MNEDWKQIWSDIVNSVRGETAPQVQVPETSDDARAVAPVNETPAVSVATDAGAVVSRAEFDPSALVADQEAGAFETEAFTASAAPSQDAAAEIELLARVETDAAEMLESVAEESDSLTLRTLWTRWRGRLGAVGVAVIALGMLAILFFPQLAPQVEELLAPKPPAPDIVATFKDGEITRDQLLAHLAVLVPKEAQERVRTFENLRALAQEMVLDELIRRWAAERKVDSQETFSHTMQHISEELNLDSLHSQMHTSEIPVQESEIQAYYQQNQEQFQGKTLDEAREEIRQRLASERENSYMQEYIDRLRANASITKDLALLDVPEPTEDDLKKYYDANRAQFKLPTQVVVDELEIPIEDDEQDAKQRADKALLRIRSGASFVQASQEITGTNVLTATTVVSGTRSANWETVVWGLQPNEISEVINDDGDVFSIVRLRELQPERVATFAEMRPEILELVRQQKTDEWFKTNGAKILFTLKGQRYSLEQFYKEYKELPLETRAKYEGADGRKRLAEDLITRLLVVEDTYDRLLDVKNKDELEETRLDVLKQMYHQENVDDQIKISDEAAQKFYDENKARLVKPPEARIRYLRIGLGQTEDEEKRAQEKANEAFRKLVPGPFQQGADFAAIASEYSEDQESAAKGGELDGWVGEGFDTLAELSEHPFHERVLSLGVNEISLPFFFGDSLYIVQVIERSDPQPIPFEQAKELIREKLTHDQHDELLANLSERVTQDANIVIYDSVLRALVAEFAPAQTPTPEE